MEAFTVKNGCGELYKKHYPPSLQVWCLDREGWSVLQAHESSRYHDSGALFTVGNHGPSETAQRNGTSNKMWEGTVEHVKTFKLSGKLNVLYTDEEQNIGVIFNNVFQLVGLRLDGISYLPGDSLFNSEKVYVDRLVKIAYEDQKNVVEYDRKALIGLKLYEEKGFDSHMAGVSTR